MNGKIGPAQIQEAHAMYCQLTGQKLSLEYDRERGWFELLKKGYGLEDVRRVIRYLQREIRRERRNVGSLKLRNLLQVDQFEEDLNISRVRLDGGDQEGGLRKREEVVRRERGLGEEETAKRRAEVVEQLKELKSSL